MSTEDALCQELITGLSNEGLTVAVAESLTGGLLCAAFVHVPGASHAVRGGVCTYATDTKHSVLKVSDQRLAQTGPVDDEVARQMAHGVRTLMVRILVCQRRESRGRDLLMDILLERSMSLARGKVVRGYVVLI